MIKQYNQYIYKDGQWLLVGASDQNNFITYILQKDGDTITLKGDDDSTSDVVIKEFSDEAKAKLENIAAGAQVNVLEGVKVNGTKLTIDGEKLVDISVPTKLSQLTNDADYVTDANYVHTDNNYTTAEKNKLAGIAASADVNTIEQIKVNNSALTPDGNKIVNITVPTKLTDLTNDNNFVTDANYVHTDNNYTTAEKNKLAGLSNYDDTEIKQQIAQAGKIDTIKVNGTAQPVVDKTVSLTIPTVPTNISAFTNDKKYQTEDEVTSLIADAVGEIQTLEYSVVGSLPATGEVGVIYLVSNGGANPNIYDEYIYINGNFEKIGTTEVNLSGYLTKTEAGQVYAKVTDLKTINGQSLLGNGQDIKIRGCKILNVTDWENGPIESSYEGETIIPNDVFSGHRYTNTYEAVKTQMELNETTQNEFGSVCIIFGDVGLIGIYSYIPANNHIGIMASSQTRDYWEDGINPEANIPNTIIIQGSPNRSQTAFILDIFNYNNELKTVNNRILRGTDNISTPEIWQSNTSYLENQIVFHEDKIYKAVKNIEESSDFGFVKGDTETLSPQTGLDLTDSIVNFVYSVDYDQVASLLNSTTTTLEDLIPGVSSLSSLLGTSVAIKLVETTENIIMVFGIESAIPAAETDTVTESMWQAYVVLCPRQDDGTVSIEDFSKIMSDIIDVIFVPSLKEQFFEQNEITPDDLIKYYYPIENESIVYINNSINVIDSISRPVEDYNWIQILNKQNFIEGPSTVKELSKVPNLYNSDTIQEVQEHVGAIVYRTNLKEYDYEIYFELPKYKTYE